MNPFIAIPALIIACLAFAVAVVNAVGKDHVHKRWLLARGAILLAWTGAFFAAGWFSARSNHDGNVQPQGEAANKEEGKPNNDKVAHKNTPLVYLKTPTPDEIREAIEKVPPLARKAAMSQFIGTAVTWDGKVERESNDRDRSYLLIGNVGGDFFIMVDEKNESALARLPKEANVNVRGVIGQFADDNRTPTLFDVVVTPLPSDPAKKSETGSKEAEKSKE